MTLRLHPGTVTADTDDGTVLLNQRNGGYWQLNATGSYALDRLLDGHPLDRVAQEFATAYGMTPAQTRAELTSLTAHLRAAGLVDVA